MALWPIALIVLIQQLWRSSVFHRRHELILPSPRFMLSPFIIISPQSLLLRLLWQLPGHQTMTALNGRWSGFELHLIWSIDWVVPYSEAPEHLISLWLWPVVLSFVSNSLIWNENIARVYCKRALWFVVSMMTIAIWYGFRVNCRAFLNFPPFALSVDEFSVALNLIVPYIFPITSHHHLPMMYILCKRGWKVGLCLWLYCPGRLISLILWRNNCYPFYVCILILNETQWDCNAWARISISSCYPSTLYVCTIHEFLPYLLIPINEWFRETC